MTKKKKKKIEIDASHKKSVMVFLDYFKELFRKIYILILFALIAFFLANYYLSKQTSTYTATLTFMTTDDNTSGYSPLMQIAGQLGLSPSAGTTLSSEKLVELLHSRLIVLSTLMKKVKIENKEDLLINHFHRIYNVNDWYIDKPRFQNMVFENIELNFFSEKENKVANDIYSKIIREYLVAGSSKNGIIKLTYTSDSEVFAKEFLDFLVDGLSEFYISKTNQRHRETFNIVSKYTDSLKNELVMSELNLAEWKDKNVLKVKSRGVLEELRLLRKVETLNTAYTEALKNLELAKFNLISSTPILQIIDQPVLPLKRNKPNILFIYAIPIIISIIFASILVLVWKFFRDALR